MTFSEPARVAARPSPPKAPSSSAETRITIYECGADEAVLFERMAPRFGVSLTLVEEAISETNVKFARGSRCVSVGHKTRVTNPVLLALSRAGVAYVSTRSIGYDHLDTGYARSVGITVGNVAYSPDGVADYTLMLILMAIRNAKSIMCRAEAHDYRLPEARSKELRDLTVGVVGTGRIGTAVIDRLQGFGCQIQACDDQRRAGARYVPLEELLQTSDIVTLHTPLTSATFHLLNERRIGLMKPGAIVVNTGRGALVDTQALVAALEGGRLGAAALDVLEGEDGIFYADRRGTAIENALLLRLQGLPNALISPHTAYYTEHALNDTVVNSLINCIEFNRETAAWTG